MLRTLGFVLVACLWIGAGSVSAQPTVSAAATKPSDAPLPSCLDETIAEQVGADLKPRGVQRRDFLKRGHINVVLHGGMYSGDMTSSSWLAGGSVGMFFTEDFGVAAEFDVNPLTLDLDAPISKFFGDTRFNPGLAYTALGNVMWSPIHAKLKLGGGIVHSDILVIAGAGRMFHDAVQGIAYDAGLAIDMFVSHAATIRLGLRDLMAVQEIAAETHFTNNLVATIGLALWIPTGL